MAYTAQNFDHLLGLSGMSDTLLQNHFKLYQGYVTNTNTLLEKLKTATVGTPEFAELHRRLGWEFNGMRLHELYFGNLKSGGVALDATSALGAAITATWGSYDTWLSEFKALGSMRGIGWVILYQDPTNGALINTWIAEHDGGHLSGATPLLVMDVFEHAYMVDYGLNKAEYLNAFVAGLDGDTASKRFVQ
jgi:Fe-Mn family superoxide dismutase